MKHRYPLSPPRRDERTLLPALLAGLLLVGAVLQLMLTHEPELPDAVAGRLPPVASVADPSPVFADPIIGGRPLFSPTRRPGDAPRVLGPDGGAAPLGGAIVAGAIRARGIARVLLRLPTGAVRELAPGGDYLGWVLVAITPDGARFRKGTDKLTVAYGSSGAVAAAPTGEDQ